jgi:hypothetical protein
VRAIHLAPVRRHACVSHKPDGRRPCHHARSAPRHLAPFLPQSHRSSAWRPLRSPVPEPHRAPATQAQEPNVASASAREPQLPPALPARGPPPPCALHSHTRKPPGGQARQFQLQLLFARMALSPACTPRCHSTRTGTLLRSCRRREYGPAAVMSIAHANIVSPLASQHAPNQPVRSQSAAELAAT